MFNFDYNKSPILNYIKEESSTKDRFYYYLILFFCLFLPFQFALNPTTGIDLAIARVFISLLFLSYFVFIYKNKLDSIKYNNTTTKLLLSYLAFMVISISFSDNIIWSLRKILFPLSIVPIYFLTTAILNTPKRKLAAISALVLGGGAVAVVGIMQFFAQFIFSIDTVYSFLAMHVTPFFLGRNFSAAVISYPSWLVNSNGVTYMRATANFPDPHMLSYYLGLLIPWSIALWTISSTHKKIFLITTLLIIIADVLTFTRGGYIALIAGAFVILPLVSWKNIKKIFLGIVLLFFLFTLVPHNPVAGRFVSSFDAKEGSNQGRLSNWQQALSIIKNNPLGVGIGSYSLAVDPAATYREPIYAHNAYLDIAAELGIPAAIVFIFILLSVFKSFCIFVENKPFYIAGVASITIFSVHSLVENPLYSVHILPLFFIIIAISTNLQPYEKDSKSL